MTSHEVKQPLSIVDVFITYAWTPGAHREWVRLLAAALQAMGFNVRVDANLDYGNGVTGFMRQVVEARHVLMIADENYVHRADDVPGSGAYIENGWLREVYAQKPSTWLTVMFKDNPGFKVPAWLAEHDPKGLNFNANHETGDFPGAEQLVDLWRWLADQPADRKNAVSPALLRARAARLEHVAARRDPGAWRHPQVADTVSFEFRSAPETRCWLGNGIFEFIVKVGQAGTGTIYVYSTKEQAVGVVPPQTAVSDVSPEELTQYLTTGDFVVVPAGTTVALLNEDGIFCLVEITEITDEVNKPGEPYTAPKIDFTYTILTDF